MTNKMQLLLEKLQSEKFAMSGSKINQKVRNELKREFVGVFVEYLNAEIGSELVSVVETQKGIGIAIDNDKVGIIPIELVPTFKDLDCDIIDLAEEFKEHQAEMAEKKAENERKKAEKIAQDKAIREKKAEIKALKENGIADTENDFNDIE